MNQDLIEKIRQNLTDGLVVDTYKEMCQLLAQTEKKGSSKQNQLKEWKLYFDYYFWGRKIIVKRIYNDVEIRINLFQKELEDSIIYEFCLFLDIYYKALNYNVMAISNSRLAQIIGFINYNYSNFKLNEMDLSKKNENNVSKFESNLISKNFNPINSMDTDLLEKYKKHVLVNRRSQTVKKLNQALKIKEAENEVRTDEPFFRTDEDELNIKNGIEAMSDFINNNSEAFEPDIITKEVLEDFYFHLNNNFNYRLKKAISILEKNHIIEDFPCYMGIPIIPRKVTPKEIKELKKPKFISTEELAEISEALDNELNELRIDKLNAIYSPDEKVRKRASKVLREFGYSKIYKVHKFIIFPNNLKHSKEFYNSTFLSKYFNEDFLRNIILNTSEEFKKQALINFQKREDRKGRTPGRKSDLMKIQQQLYKILIEYLLGIPEYYPFVDIYNFSDLEKLKEQENDDDNIENENQNIKAIARIPQDWKSFLDKSNRNLPEFIGIQKDDIDYLKTLNKYDMLPDLLESVDCLQFYDSDSIDIKNIEED